ncbi:MAG TPA: hypothetical protein VMD48_06485, partial [Solirubrobacteraceae bacterium]|nr:hypothetical protein [Solirubrobacteraceae bacterium]
MANGTSRGAEVVGEDALVASDRGYLRARTAFDTDVLSQPLDESRSLGQTLDRAWDVALLLSRGELSMISRANRHRCYGDRAPDSTG